MRLRSCPARAPNLNVGQALAELEEQKLLAGAIQRFDHLKEEPLVILVDGKSLRMQVGRVLRQYLVQRYERPPLAISVIVGHQVVGAIR